MFVNAQPKPAPQPVVAQQQPQMASGMLPSSPQKIAAKPAAPLAQIQVPQTQNNTNNMVNQQFMNNFVFALNQAPQNNMGIQQQQQKMLLMQQQQQLQQQQLQKQLQFAQQQQQQQNLLLTAQQNQFILNCGSGLSQQQLLQPQNQNQNHNPYGQSIEQLLANQQQQQKLLLLQQQQQLLAQQNQGGFKMPKNPQNQNQMQNPPQNYFNTNLFNSGVQNPNQQNQMNNFNQMNLQNQKFR